MSEQSMVERVGAAILAKVPEGYGMTPDEAVAYARAAIEAMRNADFDVLDAGMSVPITAYRERRGHFATLEDAHISGQHILNVWQAGIDAALSPISKDHP